MFVMRLRVLRAIQLLLPLFFISLLGACSNSSSGVTQTQPTVAGLNVTPVTVQLPAGTQTRLVAIATYSNGDTVDVSDLASWSSENTAVATVDDSLDNGGRVTAVGVGTTNVVASFRGAVDGAIVTVTSAELSRIEVDPATATIAAGTTQQYTATAIFTDGTVSDVTELAAWSSDDTNAATVSNTAGSRGLATGEAMGSANIQASYQGEVASGLLNVTAAVITGLEIEPRDANLPTNRTLQYSATATFSDDSVQTVTADATWTSGNTDLVTISNAAGSEGLAEPVAEGGTTIIASFMGETAQTGITVVGDVAVSEIVVTPASASIAKGTQQQFMAEAVYADNQTEDVTAEATWASTDPSVATVSNADGSEGLATGEEVGGPVDIEATFLGVTGAGQLTVTDAELVSISVEPANASAPAGTTRQFTAIGTYSDSSTQDITTNVVWSSSDPNVASISNAAGSEGLAGANAQGSVVITATDGGSNISGETGFTVTAAVLQSLQVEPAGSQFQLANGFRLQFIATGFYSDGSSDTVTSQATWVSTDEALATVSNTSGSRGQVTAASSGTGNLRIQATLDGQFASAPLEITNATLTSLAVTPTNESLPVGRTLQYTATGTFSGPPGSQDLTTQVTWNSSVTSKATISAAGVATAVAVGDGNPVTITATHVNSGQADSTPLTVTDAVVVSMTISPQSASRPEGRTQQFTVSAILSDNSTRNVTEEANWSSGDAMIATVSNTAGSKGLATAVSTGTTSIAATHPDGPSVSASFEVTDAVLESLTVSPNPASVANGVQQQFTAQGTYSDGSTPDETANVTWASSVESVATISNAAGSEGRASTHAVGSTNITAQLDGVSSGNVPFTVTAATVQSIAIDPPSASMPEGTTRDFTATATFTDSSTQNVTTQATWSSTDRNVADVCNASGCTKGRVVANSNAGTADISAAFGGQTGISTVTATNAVLQSIVVTPANATINQGATQQYTATGHFSDGSSANITTSVTWSTLDSSVATITPGGGLATGVGPGTTSVRASGSGGVEGATGLTVVAP